MIALKPDLVIAFWDRKSRGTKGTMELAIKAEIPLIVEYGPIEAREGA